MSAPNRRLLILLFLVTILLGAFEGLYGRTRYSGDAISYLNVVRMIHAGNWKAAFNPLWGIGYPLMLSVVTRVFPQTPLGDWFAIHSLDLIIFAAACFAFNYLALTAARSARLRWIMADEGAQRFLILGVFSVFLAVELTMDNVSRVGPDMLVSCLMFLGAALLIKLQARPEIRVAIALGVILGLGCSVKNVFLPMTLVFAAVALFTQREKIAGVKLSAAMLLSAAVFILPYVWGLSWAAGHFTFGESGKINYAWHVNKLEDGAFWQGGPAEFGKPIHPPQMVFDHPHVYLFAQPFPVTFPLFYNAPYYYEGYRQFFSPTLQLKAIAHNLYRVVKIFRTQFILFALAVCWLLRRRGTPRTRNELGLLPITLVGLAGIALYVMVWLEDRYISSFVCLLSLVVLFVVLAAARPTEQTPAPRWGDRTLSWILIAGCALTLAANQHDDFRDVMGHLRRHQIFVNDEQWKAGMYLQKLGLVPGDHVAIVSDLLSSTQSTWAYMDGLEIIGQLRGEKPPYATDDFDVFWHSSPERQKEILEIFHTAGARLVLAMDKPDGVTAPGWEPVPGTKYWIYRF